MRESAKYKEWIEGEGLIKLKAMHDNGNTPKEISEKIGISEQTFCGWIKRFPTLREIFSQEDNNIDRQVEQALLKRAIGYTQREIVRQMNKDGVMEITKIVEKEVMPSTTAQIFWLKNRCGYEWDSKDGEEPDEEGGIVVLPPRIGEYEYSGEM